MSEPTVSAILPPPTDFRERMRSYDLNRPKFSPDALRPHAERWVAFRWDGTAIVASDADFETLVQRLVQLGMDPHRDVMYEWVHDESQALLLEHAACI